MLLKRLERIFVITWRFRPFVPLCNLSSSLLQTLGFRGGGARGLRAGGAHDAIKSKHISTSVTACGCFKKKKKNLLKYKCQPPWGFDLYVSCRASSRQRQSVDLRVDKGVLLLHRETDGECLQGGAPGSRGVWRGVEAVMATTQEQSRQGEPCPAPTLV